MKIVLRVSIGGIRFVWLGIGEDDRRNIRWEWFFWSGSFVVENIQNVHHTKIDVIKFDGTNNFRLWRCEVLDKLNAQNLEDTLEFQERPVEVDKKV